MNLMENVTAVDTTLFFHQGRWWLFTGMPPRERDLPFAELYLFYSVDLFSREWRPHPLNPIVTDLQKSRPAGSIFSRDGKIYRPSQDCSKTYGHGFDLNEILVLSETEYRETTAVSVRPDWDKKVVAAHTFAYQGGLTVIDAFMERPKFF